MGKEKFYKRIVAMPQQKRRNKMKTLQEIKDELTSEISAKICEAFAETWIIQGMIEIFADKLIEAEKILEETKRKSA